MNDRTLLKGQRNDVFKIVMEAGLAADQFDWQEAASAFSSFRISVLKHSSGYFFKFDVEPGGVLNASRTPGKDTRFEKTRHGSWENEKVEVAEWAKLLYREVTEPDLWAAVSGEKNIAQAAAGQIENSPFSSEEQKRLGENIEEIKQFLFKTASLSREQMSYVNDRFLYLAEASSRLGRKDWINLALSVLVSIIVGVGLPSGSAGELLRFAGQVFHWVLKGQLFFPI